MPGTDQRICVVGLGYIGLPTASLLANRGHNVLGVDISQRVVDTINEGNIHIVEPDLDILVRSAVNSGRLIAKTSPEKSDVFIIAVPTPFKKSSESEQKIPDLSYVEAAAHAIAPLLDPGNLVILESTSPVGTTNELIADIIASHGHNVDEDIYIAHCPERVMPGKILIELMENDRVVGGINERSTKRAQEFYQNLVRGEVFATNSKTAEMVKLVENSFRDVNIAFANELSMICDQENINTWDVINLANRHPRVNILKPGPGVGGHCIAVDPWFIVHRAGAAAKLIKTARLVNDSKPDWVLNRVRCNAAKFKNPVIGCLGISFKADIDDLRESPSLDIVRHIVSEKIGSVLICEPNLDHHDEFDLLSITEVIKRSDIILVLVDHKQFKTITAAMLKEKIVIDTRGIIN